MTPMTPPLNATSNGSDTFSSLFLGLETSMDIFRWRRLYWSSYWVFLVMSLTYLALIKVIPPWLHSRGFKPRDLRMTLATWNIILSIFSILFMVRSVPELANKWRKGGGSVKEFLCVSDEWSHSPTTNFWQWAFAVSKIFELGDTAWIILRGRPVIFLHWYHHSTALLMAIYFFIQAEPYYIFVTTFNTFVHTIMYFYYALKALEFHVPKWVSMSITSLQLTQFVSAIGVTCFALREKVQRDCQVGWVSIIFSYVFVLSYFILFAKFFVGAYLNKKSKVKLGSAGNKIKMK